MSIINSLLFSYVNSKGKTIKGIRFGSGQNDRFPFEVYSQPAMRFAMVLRTYGKSIIGILDKFAAEQPYVADKGLIGSDVYQGHKLMVFSLQDGDKNAVKIGKGKVVKLAAAIKEHGLESVLETLAEVVGDAKPMDSKPPRKGGKKSGAGGAKAKPEMTEEADPEVLDHRFLEHIQTEDKLAQIYKLIQKLFDQIGQLQAECRELQAATATA